MSVAGAMRGQQDQWDIFVTHHGFVPDPILITFMGVIVGGVVLSVFLPILDVVGKQGGG